MGDPETKLWQMSPSLVLYGLQQLSQPTGGKQLSRNIEGVKKKQKFQD